MLYGKWRPRGFDEVAGQDHIVRTLRNALASGQVAHAYLFSGPRGTGKTTTARILARSLNCANLSDGEPCNTCAPCRAILAGNALDLIEMDAASNRGIEDIRELREKIAFAPSDLTKKVYLLDEVHMLTDGAFNALLKTLEEPPPHAVFILATTDLHKVPATIISRCQRYDFHRVPNDAIIERLQFICEQEGFSVPRDGLLAIAVQSRGGLRDAITMLEQVTARYGNAVTVEDVRAAMGQVSDSRVAGLVSAILADDLGGVFGLAVRQGNLHAVLVRSLNHVVVGQNESVLADDDARAKSPLLARLRTVVAGRGLIAEKSPQERVFHERTPKARHLHRARGVDVHDTWRNLLHDGGVADAHPPVAVNWFAGNRHLGRADGLLGRQGHGKPPGHRQETGRKTQTTNAAVQMSFHIRTVFKAWTRTSAWGTCLVTFRRTHSGAAPDRYLVCCASRASPHPTAFS